MSAVDYVTIARMKFTNPKEYKRQLSNIKAQSRSLSSSEIFGRFGWLGQIPDMLYYDIFDLSVPNSPYKPSWRGWLVWIGCSNKNWKSELKLNRFQSVIDAIWAGCLDKEFAEYNMHKSESMARYRLQILGIITPDLISKIMPSSKEIDDAIPTMVMYNNIAMLDAFNADPARCVNIARELGNKYLESYYTVKMCCPITKSDMDEDQVMHHRTIGDIN